MMASGSELGPASGFVAGGASSRLAVTPTPSHCWRVFVSDRLGRTWSPIVAADDAREVRAKALAIYRGGTVLEAQRLHHDLHAHEGRAAHRDVA